MKYFTFDFYLQKISERLRAHFADALYPEAKTRRNELEREANTDALTRLPNRRAFDRALAVAEDDPEVWFVMFDCDDFKKINDSLGHSAGDAALVFIASCIQNAAVSLGVTRVFRYGGDEFVVLCPFAIARRLAEAAQAECAASGAGVTLSFGIGARIEIADRTLIQTKRARRANTSEVANG